MLHVYSMAYNEEVIIKFMIDHYRERFPACKITIFDNESTDKTAEIARENNCEVINYPTNKQVDDQKLKNLKDNCWKNSDEPWVCVCDTDELLEINEQDLKNEEALGTTIIKTEAYNMVNDNDDYNLAGITRGTRCTAYDKDLIFNKKFITNINYVHGGHKSSPAGIAKPSSKIYTLYHYININPELTFNKHRYTKERLSELNKRMGWGVQYNRDVPLEEVQGWYRAAREQAVKVR